MNMFTLYYFPLYIYNDAVVCSYFLEVTQNKTPQKVMPITYFF